MTQGIRNTSDDRAETDRTGLGRDGAGAPHPGATGRDGTQPRNHPDEAGGVRRQDGPEPLDEAPVATGDDPAGNTPGFPDQSGYEENGPGRGNYPGRGGGEGAQPRRGEDAELDAKSRWRDGDQEGGSERWTDDAGDGVDPAP